MSPTELREYITVLAEMRAAGVKRVSLPLWGDVKAPLEVEFTDAAGPPVDPVSPFVDRDGHPVNLDAGNPWIEPPAVDPVETANFAPAKANG